jgi:hypothetical protein
MFWQERTPGIDQPSSDQDRLQSRPVTLKDQSNFKKCGQRKEVVTKNCGSIRSRAGPGNEVESVFQTRTWQTVTEYMIN